MKWHMNPTDMIAFDHLTVRYRSAECAAAAAIADVSLTVPQGTVCAIIGPSGCGKSTLLRAVAGLVQPESGCVKIAGGKADPKKYRIGFMPQNYGLLPWRTALENVLLGPRIRKQDVAAAKERAGELFTQLGIAGLEDRFPKELSGGQQQRVALARAFLLAPDLLLMDEPFSALDAITREEMQDVFLTLWREAQTTTVLVTHYVEEALYLGRTIVLMRAGGTIAETIDNPLFGREGLRDDPAYFALARQLREKIRNSKAVPRTFASLQEGGGPRSGGGSVEGRT